MGRFVNIGSVQPILLAKYGNPTTVTISLTFSAAGNVRFSHDAGDLLANAGAGGTVIAAAAAGTVTVAFNNWRGELWAVGSLAGGIPGSLE